MSRRSDAKRGDESPKTRRGRGALGRTFMGVPVLRRWYVRRTLRFIDRSRAKGRRLPEGMAETARYLARFPRQQRARALEDAILANRDLPNQGREFRRAAARQRRSGRNGGHHRPGLPPGAIKPGRQGRP